MNRKVWKGAVRHALIRQLPRAVGICAVACIVRDPILKYGAPRLSRPASLSRRLWRIKEHITFDDAAGIDDVRQELAEIVDPLTAIAISRDRAQTALRESEAKLMEAQRIAKIGVDQQARNPCANASAR